MEIDNRKYCRICTNGNTEMTSIFEHYKLSECNLQIFEVITKCASVQIQKLDGFSEQICKRCMQHLNEAFSFKQLCEDSDYKLRHYLIEGHNIASQEEYCDKVAKIQSAEVYENDINNLTDIKTEIKSEFYAEQTKIQYGEHQLHEEKFELTVNTESSGNSKNCSNENKHICKFCDQSFSETTNNHRGTEDETNEREISCNKADDTINSYKCEECDKCFKEKAQLRSHRRNHIAVRPYKCEICSKSFRGKLTLKVHRRIHTGEKPFKCETCNKSFSQQSVLNRHKRRHTGEKPYKCETCNKCFSEKRKFNLHVQSHIGEKRYKCEMCGKGFNEKGRLIEHIRIHTGEKPHVCEMCGKCFSRTSNLNVHKRTHTGEKPYKCKTCNKYFAQLSTLSRHSKTHS